MASVTFMIETMEADDGDRKNVNSSSELLLLLHLGYKKISKIQFLVWLDFYRKLYLGHQLLLMFQLQMSQVRQWRNYVYGI